MTEETPVSDIMSSPVETTERETSVDELASLLVEENIGSVVVGADRIEGIVTEKDVVRSVAEERELATAVEEIMSEPVVTVRPTDSIRVASERMSHNVVKKLPVTEGATPVGIVTTTDLAVALPRLAERDDDAEPSVLDETPASEIMASPVASVAGDATVAEVSEVIVERNIGSVVVGDDRVEGIVTEADVVQSVAEGVSADAPVSEVMSEPVVTIRPTESIREAGERMGKNAVKKLPVTEDGEAVGIVTTTDLTHFLPQYRVALASRREADIDKGEWE